MGDHVFICYARADQYFVSRLAANLKDRGVTVWLDQWDIPYGADWDQAIDLALLNCARFLIVLSPASVASKQVRGELQTALDANKPIVPVIHSECQVPRSLRLTQYINFMARDPDDETALSQVLSALRGSESVPPMEVREVQEKARQSENERLVREALEKDKKVEAERITREEKIKAYADQLKKGVSAWNDWKSKAKVSPDLSNEDLSELNLLGVDFSLMHLRRTILRETNLREANLQFASLRRADLSGANLTLANLGSADCRGADFTEADLTGANLCRADLTGAILTRANFHAAKITYINLLDVVGFTEEQFASSDKTERVNIQNWKRNSK